MEQANNNEKESLEIMNRKYLELVQENEKLKTKLSSTQLNLKALTSKFDFGDYDPTIFPTEYKMKDMLETFCSGYVLGACEAEAMISMYGSKGFYPENNDRHKKLLKEAFTYWLRHYTGINKFQP